MNLHQAQFGPHQAQSNPHQAQFGPHQAQSNPHQAQFGPHPAQLGPHPSQLNLHQAQLGPHPSQLYLHKLSEQLSRASSPNWAYAGSSCSTGASPVLPAGTWAMSAGAGPMLGASRPVSAQGSPCGSGVVLGAVSAQGSPCGSPLGKTPPPQAPRTAPPPPPTVVSFGGLAGGAHLNPLLDFDRASAPSRKPVRNKSELIASFLPPWSASTVQKMHSS